MKRHGYSTRLRTHPKAPYLHAARHPPLALHLGYGVLFLTAVIALPTMLRTGRVEQMAAAAGVGVANAASDAPTSTLAPTLASAPVPAPRLAAAGRASHNVCHWHERPHPSNRVPTEDGALAEASLLEPERPRAIRPPLARSRGAALRPSLAAWRSFALGLCVGALAAAVVLWHSLARRRAHLDRAERELCLREARTVRLELELDDRAHDAIVSCGQWEEYARQCAHERESALEQLELVRVHAQALQVRARRGGGGGRRARPRGPRARTLTRPARATAPPRRRRRAGRGRRLLALQGERRRLCAAQSQLKWQRPARGARCVAPRAVWRGGGRVVAPARVVGTAVGRGRRGHPRAQLGRGVPLLRSEVVVVPAHRVRRRWLGLGRRGGRGV